MRNPKRLDSFYKEFCEIHKKYFPDWRFGQLCSNFFGWLMSEEKRDLFFPEENEMLKHLREYTKSLHPDYKQEENWCYEILVGEQETVKALKEVTVASECGFDTENDAVIHAELAMKDAKEEFPGKTVFIRTYRKEG